MIRMIYSLSAVLFVSFSIFASQERAFMDSTKIGYDDSMKVLQEFSDDQKDCTAFYSDFPYLDTKSIYDKKFVIEGFYSKIMNCVMGKVETEPAIDTEFQKKAGDIFDAQHEAAIYPFTFEEINKELEKEQYQKRLITPTKTNIDSYEPKNKLEQKKVAEVKRAIDNIKKIDRYKEVIETFQFESNSDSSLHYYADNNPRVNLAYTSEDSKDVEFVVGHECEHVLKKDPTIPHYLGDYYFRLSVLINRGDSCVSKKYGNIEDRGNDSECWYLYSGPSYITKRRVEEKNADRFACLYNPEACKRHIKYYFYNGFKEGDYCKHENGKCYRFLGKDEYETFLGRVQYLTQVLKENGDFVRNKNSKNLD